MSCGAVPKWHFCTIRASWRAQRCSMLDNRSSTSKGPTAHCQVAPECNELLPSTDLASGSSVQLTWLAQTLRWHTQSRVELLKWITGGELLRLADVMTGEAHQFCERFSYARWCGVLSMKADHRRLLQEAELMSGWYRAHKLDFKELGCFVWFWDMKRSQDKSHAPSAPAIKDFFEIWIDHTRPLKRSHQY